jgi:hypothetical protein
LIEIADFGACGWSSAESAQIRPKACCELLERGEILLLRDSTRFLNGVDVEALTQLAPSAVAHKNIAYDADSGEVRGLRRGVDAEPIRKGMARYQQRAVASCASLLAPYARTWRVELTSFRPLEEKGRRLPHRQRNDLLHIDSFPARPTGGARILRCFTNIHPTRARVWKTSNPFKALSKDLLADNLESVASRANSPWRRLAEMARVLGGVRSGEFGYDEFMQSLHDRMKTDRRYRADALEFRQEFPPGATWLVFTDAVPHAVLEGRYALEQTFFIPLEAMRFPDEAPARLIERLAGRRMTA